MSYRDSASPDWKETALEAGAEIAVHPLFPYLVIPMAVPVGVIAYSPMRPWSIWAYWALTGTTPLAMGLATLGFYHHGSDLDDKRRRYRYLAGSAIGAGSLLLLLVIGFESGYGFGFAMDLAPVVFLLFAIVLALVSIGFELVGLLQ